MISLRRRWRHPVAVVCAAACAVLAAGCGSAARTAVSRTTSAATTAAATAARRTSRRSHRAPRTVAPRSVQPRRPRRPSGPPPGTLPQTAQLPSAGTRAFHAEMAALWRGVEQGSAGPAMPAFFPEAAYVQIKTIGDPQADWLNRLVGDYRLDLGAAHALVGSGPAHLVGVQVPAGYAHWVPPGVCDNRVGYYEVPNSRVVYSAQGQLRSFGIASMISWRGVWYVVHLGAVLRATDTGVVDAPSAGSGVAAPSSTC